MRQNTPPPQSFEIGRGRAFEALGTNAPRASREDAWRAVGAQDIFANPAFGRGPDETDFCEGWFWFWSTRAELLAFLNGKHRRIQRVA